MAFSTLSFRDFLSKLSGRKLGAFKTAAAKCGVPFDEYVSLIESGRKCCTDCRKWKDRGEFASDRSRWDELAAKCSACAGRRYNASHEMVSADEHAHSGPVAETPSGDKVHARRLIAMQVSRGHRPRADSLHCVRCGHKGDDRRHEYHHHMGYSEHHAFDVMPLCVDCHAKEGPKAKQTHCIHGHEFTESNTIIKANGCRACRECRRQYDRGRRDAEYWRNYRKELKRRNDRG